MSGNGRPLTWHEIEACLPVPTLTVYTTDQHDPTLDPIVEFAVR